MKTQDAMIRMASVLIALAVMLWSSIGHSQEIVKKSVEFSKPEHGFVLFSNLKYPKGFKHFEYVNPDAPKGGTLRLANIRTFDNLNPHIFKGVPAPGLYMLFESLLTGALDEPQSYYGLIAESIALAKDHSAAKFTLRKEAKWQNGNPITAEDVAFSFDILRDKGIPTYKIAYKDISRVEIVDPHTVIFHFSAPNNRELPLVAGTMPIVSKAYYSKVAFEKTTLTPPLGSGPYKVDKVDAGRSITFKRDKDYWGKDLPVNRGLNNFDQIHYDVYLDETVALEALKAGDYDLRQEYISRNWATAYDSPAIKEGRIIKEARPHKLPTGMQSFVLNSRRAKLSDRRVREAIGLAFDFEWTNKTLFFDAYQRNTSFFPNTVYAATGLPSDAEKALLTPFKDTLPSALFTDVYTPPVSNGSGRDRQLLRAAKQLLEEAGYAIKDGKLLNTASGEQLTLEFMIKQPTLERPIAPMLANLKRLGIDAKLRIVDDTQFQSRVDTYDFDVISYWYNYGLFIPGNEQMALWHSSQRDIEGGRNLPGVNHPAVDKALEALTSSTDGKSLQTAARALDRILLWEHYVIPHWSSSDFRLAYWNKFGQPKIAPAYDIGLGSWWLDNKKVETLEKAGGN